MNTVELNRTKMDHKMFSWKFPEVYEEFKNLDSPENYSFISVVDLNTHETWFEAHGKNMLAMYFGFNAYWSFLE